MPERKGGGFEQRRGRWLHTLYITYAETLYRIACYRLQDANRAQDLLHSVFLAAGPKRSPPCKPTKIPWAGCCAP